MDSPDILIEGIPKAFLDQVENSLWHYFVPILALRKRERIPELKLIGSGTLIDIGGKGYILTAAHVWHEAKRADSLHLLIKKGGRAKVEIPPANIFLAREIWD